MKKRLLLLSILIITFFIIPSYFTKTLAASDEPYEMQKIVKLDKKLNVVYKTTRKYYNSGSEQLMEKTKSNYGYNDLANRSNSSKRIDLYNQLYTIYSSIYSTNETISPTDGYYVIGEINLNTIGLSNKEAMDTYYIFRHDNPLFYYSSNTFVYDDTTMYATIFEDYASGEVRQAYETSIASAINEYEDETEECTDNYNKILAVHDYLCENMSYVSTNKAYEHNIIGALIEKKGVCEAYARTFELILNYLDIENIFISGIGCSGNTSEGHAWNLVKLDNYYYWVDCTWDDQNPTIYTYFMKGNMAWDSHIPNTPDTQDFLYELPNTIADISITYQAIEVFKNGTSIGKVNTSKEAFNSILAQNNTNAEYEIVFDNMQDTMMLYLLPPGEWPEAKDIKLTSTAIELSGGGYVPISIMIYDDVTLNSNLTISGFSLTTPPGIYTQNNYSCVELNIGNHTIHILDAYGTRIGGKLVEEYIEINGIWETHRYNRVGLNIIGTRGSCIISDSTGDTMIDGDIITVDQIRGKWFTFNVGVARIGTLNSISAYFREDYDIQIDNLYISELTLQTEQPSNYNATDTRVVNIGNLNKYSDEFIPSFKFDSMKNEDIATWPTINVTGNINDNYRIVFYNDWMPTEGFKLLNVGNNSISKLSIVEYFSNNVFESISNNFYQNSSGDILTCYHSGETEQIEAHEATCIKEGNTGGIRCSICRNVISGNEAIPAKGHTYVKSITPATLSNNGKVENICECGNKELVSTIYSPTSFTLLSTSYIYNGKEQKPTVTVKDSQGNIISSSNYTITYSNGCKNVGTYDVTITFKGEYYSGTKTLTYKINEKSISGLTVSGISDKKYIGSAIKQSITVKDGDKVLKEGTDYTVSYKNNKNIGTATLTITGKGNYKDSLNKTFKINPKGTSISKLSALAKGFTAKWAKQTLQTSGYQIEYATDSKFKKNEKKATVNGNKNTSKKITKLKAKKKYYVRIRTYKTVKGTKYYSSWSKVKTIKTK